MVSLLSVAKITADIQSKFLGRMLKLLLSKAFRASEMVTKVRLKDSDWQQAAQQARKQWFPQEVLACFLHELANIRPLLAELGIEVTVVRVPVAA